MPFFPRSTLFISLFSILSLGGGWSSSGGDLISEEDNPWFLANEPLISYCVDVDEQNFGLKREAVRLVTQDAIRFWSKQFAFAKPSPDLVSQELLDDPLPFQEVQTTLAAYLDFSKLVFQEVPCDKNPELRFQFGILLPGEQTEYIAKSRPRVAVSVRTDYNEETLRGRGFIYVAPPIGPLSYKRRTDPNQTQSNPWLDHQSNRLTLALIHELGHVFGLIHGGEGVMKQEFLTELVRGKSFQLLPTLDFERHRIIFPNYATQVYQVCGTNLEGAEARIFKTLRELLKVEGSLECLEVGYLVQGDMEQPQLWASNKDRTKRVLLAKANKSFGESSAPFTEEGEFLVYLTLPEKQTLFKGLPEDAASSVGAYAVRRLSSRRQLRSQNKSIKDFELSFEFRDGVIQIGVNDSETALRMVLVGLEELKQAGR